MKVYLLVRVSPLHLGEDIRRRLSIRSTPDRSLLAALAEFSLSPLRLLSNSNSNNSYSSLKSFLKEYINLPSCSKSSFTPGKSLAAPKYLLFEYKHLYKRLLKIRYKSLRLLVSTISRSFFSLFV